MTIDRRRSSGRGRSSGRRRQHEVGAPFSLSLTAINDLVIHRRPRLSQPDLKLQHRNWTEVLIRQNHVFWQQAVNIGDQCPERLVRWNRILLVLEVVGLARLADVPTPPDIAASATAPLSAAAEACVPVP